MKTWQQILLGILIGSALTAGIFLATGTPRGKPVNLVRAEEYKIKVFLSGDVSKPGLYELAPGSRVNDLLILSGEIERQPELKVNLARILTDGEEVKIPSAASLPTGVLHNADPAQISLNSATLEQLDSLPGIGKTRAQAILDYRLQIGNFTSLDELNLVQGLSADLVEEIKPFLTIE